MTTGVKEFFISSSVKNATEAVRAALAQCCDGEETVIRFEPATYHFYMEGAYRGMFYPINNKTGEKTVMFPLLGFRHLTIDGCGAKFLFHDRVFPFVLQNTEDVELRNFTMDFTFPRYGTARIEAIGDDGMELAILGKDSRYDVDERRRLRFYAGRDCFDSGHAQFFIYDKTCRRCTYLVTGETDLHPQKMPAPVVYAFAEAKEPGRVVLAYKDGSPRFPGNVGDTLIVSYDEDRQNDMFFLDNCRSTRLHGITFGRSSGMGFIGQKCQDISVTKCICKVPEERKADEPMSITADIIHFVNCSGTIRIDDNQFEDSLDDAMNIHGTYTRVRRVLSPREVEIEYCHVSQDCTGLYVAGDKLVVSDGTSMKEKGTAVVLSETMREDHHFSVLQFIEPIEGVIGPGDLLEDPDRMPTVLMRRNVIVNCPHCRLSSARRMEITDNLLALDSADIYISDLMAFWYESGRVHDVEISRNVFSDVSDDGHACGIMIRHERGGEAKYEHENIRITDNIFALRNGRVLDASRVRNLIFENNTVANRRSDSILIQDCR